MADFNAPIMEDEPEQAAALHTLVNGSVQHSVIDLNDPALTSESLEGAFDETKDAYELPPPPPDGIYLVKLRLKQVSAGDGSQATVDYKGGRTKDGSQVYLQTAIEAEIVDPSGKQDGRKVADNFVSTMINRDKAMAVATILHANKVPPPALKTHKSWMDALVKFLKAEPTGKIQTSWEAQWDAAIEKAEKAGERRPRGSTITGMHNFPIVKGSPSPEYKWPDGTVTRARARISRYLPL